MPQEKAVRPNPFPNLLGRGLQRSSSALLLRLSGASIVVIDKRWVVCGLRMAFAINPRILKTHHGLICLSHSLLLPHSGWVVKATSNMSTHTPKSTIVPGTAISENTSLKPDTRFRPWKHPLDPLTPDEVRDVWFTTWLRQTSLDQYHIP